MIFYMSDTSDLLFKYRSKKNMLKQRLNDFRKINSEEEIFKELVFCLLTPGSRAKFCWKSTESLFDSKVILDGNPRQIKKHLIGVRFNNGKARRISDARKAFIIDGNISIGNIVNNGKNPKELREWLVENINGYGYKEASHFMRNSGYRELAILDRHILKNLEKLGVIDAVPKTLTKKNYFEIEGRFMEFSGKTGIPMDELDLLFWAEEAGLIFK